MSWFKAESKKELKSKIEVLVAEKEELVNENKDLKSKIEELNGNLSEIASDIDATPENCKRGEWCKACEFVKYYNVSHNNYYYSEIYTCGKAEACKNFVEKYKED